MRSGYGETKSAALLSLIGKCESIRSAVDPGHSIERNRAAIFAELNKSHFEVTSAELLAYAAKFVNEPVELLNRMIQQYYSFEALILFSGLPDIREDKEKAIDRQDFDAAATHRDREKETLTLVGRSFGIDIAAVQSLCNTIIEQARHDLRGATASRWWSKFSSR